VVGDFFVQRQTLSLVLAFCCLGLGAALVQDGRRVTHGHPLVSPEPRVVYGERGTNAADPYDPGGRQTTCTEEQFDAASNRWDCLDWWILVGADGHGHLSTLPPKPYGGSKRCETMEVDQKSASWRCISLA
jgi:hypothetical protein